MLQAQIYAQNVCPCYARFDEYRQETGLKFSNVNCLQCQEEHPEHRFFMMTGELGEGMAINFECPMGHRAVEVCNARKFEGLFEMGALALLDGYGREAVSSFAAALERFHEFCIRVFLRKQNIPGDQFALAWKLVANQSERQLGAYYFLFLAQFKTLPPTSLKKVEFRNNVIHKGYIPTIVEAANYGEYVYDYIIETTKTMRQTLDSEIDRVCDDDLEEMLNLVPSGTRKSVRVHWNMIWMSGPKEKFGSQPFKERLKAQKEDHWLELEERLEEHLSKGAEEEE